MRRLAIALVFFVGCALGGGAGQIVAPKAHAANVQRWEHFCMEFSVGLTRLTPEEMNTQMKGVGPEGWELAAFEGSSGKACFKRPL